MAYNYWCVVALSYDKEHAWIIYESEDELMVVNHDLFEMFDPSWVTDRRPGLYRLDGLLFDVDEEDGGFKVRTVECLQEFPVLTLPEDEFKYINRRMEQIKTTGV